MTHPKAFVIARSTATWRSQYHEPRQWNAARWVD